MPAIPATPSDELKAAIKEYVKSRPMGCVWTVNKEGYPVGRTMGATLNDDWSIDLMQAKDNGRVYQAKRNPNVNIEYNDGGLSGNINIPKVVFIKGTASFFEGDELVKRYNDRLDRMAARAGGGGHGGGGRPRMSDDDVRARLIGMHVQPAEIRVEGFGEGAEVHLFRP